MINQWVIFYYNNSPDTKLAQFTMISSLRIKSRPQTVPTPEHTAPIYKIHVELGKIKWPTPTPKVLPWPKPLVRRGRCYQPQRNTKQKVSAYAQYVKTTSLTENMNLYSAMVPVPCRQIGSPRVFGPGGPNPLSRFGPTSAELVRFFSLPLLCVTAVWSEGEVTLDSQVA